MSRYEAEGVLKTGSAEEGRPSTDPLPIEASSIGVYTMRMARVNVHLPNDLAAEAKAAGLNVSSVTQGALRSALAANRTDDWLDTLATVRATGIDHTTVAAAVAAAKDEIEGHG